MTFLFILVAFCLLVLFLVAPCRPSEEQRRPFQDRNFAHRGLHTPDKTVPENSLPAFQAAVQAGYGIELDIQLSADGEVVVFHDDTLERVCGVPGRVDARPLSQLQSLPLCDSAEHIPLFTDMLRLVHGRVPLIVELKTSARRTELCQKAWAILLQYSGAFCIESFDPRIVAWWRFHAKQVLRGQLAGAYRELRPHQPPPVCFALSRCLVNCISRPHFVAYSKRRGSWCAALPTLLGGMSVVWTAHPEDNAAALQQANDAVIFEFYTPHIRY